MLKSHLRGSRSCVRSSTKNVPISITGHSVTRFKGLLKSQRIPAHIVRSGPEGNANSTFDIVFGKPSAPKELYETIARNSRSALMKQVAADDGMDLVLAGLHLAAEDDAIKTRTHIPLPVESFSRRLDNMVTECSSLMPSGLSSTDQLDFAVGYLYDRWGLKIAKGMGDGEYSPYRVYINNVLTQKCGTPCASAALLSSFLYRMRRDGALAGLPSEPLVGLPLLIAPSGSSASANSGSASASSTSSPDSSAHLAPVAALPGSQKVTQYGPLVRWVSKVELLAEMLDQLKRFYWSWDWPLGVVSGFEACARSLMGESGRAGLVSAAVGVMQSRGRPFGNVELSVLATERLVLITREMTVGRSGGVVDRDNGWEHALQVRDLGALKIHVGQRLEGLQLLEGYSRWLEAGDDADLLGLPSTASDAADQDNTLQHYASGITNLGDSDSSSNSAGRSAAAGAVEEEAGTGAADAVAGAPEDASSTNRYNRSSAPAAQAQLVREVLLFQRRKALESAFVGDAIRESPTEFLPTDD
ncbi:hypothetical protein CEUSTIGMA_g3231.t1 [Chlamydomonas eustigma]|uniref:Protein SirB1 N-terminal domain-containing protein n=1 Tax=Chlamydomonas eustigma TaxID=1157962 RepID=A0A250WY59_9CHLO|nr:hypothetical protein CEUSTIGMA_g3231.t1 [Chlamydomonas eustigma]|eukprot:GAX75788.1 hypothetical protein CEUSTIGMA_g3231.t1 [Chlamydomonas eustigma]